MATLKNTVEILTLLDKSNCRKCNEKTCLAFAAAVFKGQRQLSDCPKLSADIIETYGGNITKRKTLEEDMDAALNELKQTITTIDLSARATAVGGTFANGKLTLKIFGKDFHIYSDGRLDSDIHVNPWLTGPVLTYIINCSVPVSGQWIPFRELKSGLAWDGLYQQRGEKPLQKIADTYPEFFEDLIHLFNGRPTDSQHESDISTVLHPLPNFPISICYWKPDDGLESDLTVFYDKTAEDNLTIGGIYALIVGIVRMFEKLSLRHGGQ